MIFEVRETRPRYFDSALLRDTNLCLVDDQDIRLGPRKRQYPLVL